MILTIDDLMKNSFVISINEQQYSSFVDIFKNISTFIPKKFNGFVIPNGIFKSAGFIKTNNVINCSISHASIIKMAQSLNMQYVGIFEDDCYPCLDIQKRLSNTLRNIPDDTDMLKLGVIGFQQRGVKPKKEIDWDKVNDFIDINNHTLGSHAYIIFNSYYQSYLDIMKKFPVADDVVMNINKHKIYSATETLFIQQRITSDGIHTSNGINPVTKISYSADYLYERFGISS